MEIKKNCEKWSSHLSQSFYYKLLIIFLFIRLHSHMLVFAGVLVRAQIFKLLLAVIEGYIVQVAVECIVAQAPDDFHFPHSAVLRDDAVVDEVNIVLVLLKMRLSLDFRADILEVFGIDELPDSGQRSWCTS